jgi:uncharacterized protein (UPF0276 family)
MYFHQQQQRSSSIGSPALATTYEGGDPLLLERILPVIDAIEVTPDSLAEFVDGKPVIPSHHLEELEQIASRKHVLVHGVGLSIASHEGPSRAYFHMLDALLERVPALWHSEHLGYVRVGGEHLGTMLAVPKTEQMLDLLCERVRYIQERYPIPFLLENVVHVLPDYPGAYSEAGFLNELTRRTGCGLILDIYNLECDAHNHGFAIREFLEELNPEPVKEFHLAGGVIDNGIRLDVHSRITEESTVRLAREALAKAPHVSAITYELLPEAIDWLGREIIGLELERLRYALWN